MTALPPAPPPWPAEGVVSWNINTACNYRCTYCTQRFKEDRGRWARDTPRFLASFARLPGRFEIKLSGGEPFVHPTLLDIVSGLAAQGHRVSIVTNFSASLDRLFGFVAAAQGRVGVLSASLHLEYVDDVHAFADKAAAVRERLEQAADPALPSPSLCVTCVATQANLPRLPELAASFRARGVVFKVQPEKQDRDVVTYSAADAAVITALGGHNLTGAIAHSFDGQLCFAGTRYFILDDLGTAYRCYPARRHRLERLGDFLADSFSLGEGPTPCRYAYCNCTVPIARGMMAGAPVRGGSLAG